MVPTLTMDLTILLQCCHLNFTHCQFLRMKYIFKVGNTGYLYFSCNTVWKFQDSYAIKILREINFRVSRSAKLAILKHFENLNFDFNVILHFFES